MPPGGGAADIPVRFAFLDILAFVELQFSVADSEQHLNPPVLPIERQRDEGIAFNRSFGGQFSDLGTVEQQLARNLRDVVHDIPVGILIDVDIVEPHLVLLHPRKGISNLATPRSEGFDFRATEHQSSLIGLQNMIVPAGFGIGQQVCHKQQKPEGCALWQ